MEQRLEKQIREGLSINLTGKNLRSVLTHMQTGYEYFGRAVRIGEEQYLTKEYDLDVKVDHGRKRTLLDGQYKVYFTWEHYGKLFGDDGVRNTIDLRAVFDNYKALKEKCGDDTYGDKYDSIMDERRSISFWYKRTQISLDNVSFHRQLIQNDLGTKYSRGCWGETYDQGYLEGKIGDQLATIFDQVVINFEKGYDPVNETIKCWDKKKLSPGF